MLPACCVAFFKETAYDKYDALHVHLKDFDIKGQWWHFLVLIIISKNLTWNLRSDLI